MKRIFPSICLFFCVLFSICSFSQQTTEEHTKSHSALIKMSMQMERLRSEGKWLEAMDTATLILTYNDQYRPAVDFVYRNWDKTMRLTDKQLQGLSDEQSLKQAEERCEIYRILDEVHRNLSEVRMPLYGPNQKWVWQPEIGYYTGHYDTERGKTIALLLSKANEALRNLDAQEAQIYYQLALNKYMLTENERKSNKKQIIEQCNNMINKHCQSDKIFNSIFAYDLCDISLQFESEQPDIVALQEQIQRHIADLYLQESEIALQAGDSVQAYQMYLSYEEWNISLQDEKTND